MQVEVRHGEEHAPATPPDAARPGQSDPAGAVPHRWRYREALAALLGSQKPSAGVPLYLRYVNRPLGRRLAALAAVVGLSPHQVTLASGACSLLGFAVVALWAPTAPVVLVAFALLVLAYALDSADGQLARLTGRSGPSGEWLDHVVDVARIPLFHLALLVSVHRFTDLPDAWALAAWAFALVATTRFFALILASQLLGTEGKGAATGGRLRSLAHLPTDTGTTNALVLLLVWTPAFVAGYAVLLVVTTLATAASLVRKFSDLERRRTP